MSSEGWDALGPRVAPALGAQQCDAAYNTLVNQDTHLADAVDAYARADGPTDDLLAQVSGAALGDLILVVTFAGKLPRRVVADAGTDVSPVTQPGFGSRGGGRGMRRQGGGSRPEPLVDVDALDISASLFSVAQSRSVALVALHYSGTSLTEAVAQFAAKLAQSLPGTRCVGWNWEKSIDPDRIRGMIER